MGIYGQCHKSYCFVTLTFNFKVTGGLLKVRFWPFFSHFGPVLIYRKLDHPMAGIYNIYICPLSACRNLTLMLFIEGHPQTDKVPHQGIFGLFGVVYGRASGSAGSTGSCGSAGSAFCFPYNSVTVRRILFKFGRFRQ